MKGIAPPIVFFTALGFGIVAGYFAWLESWYDCSFGTGCDRSSSNVMREVRVIPDESEKNPLIRDVSVCELKNDPARFNHLAVKVTGYFSRGFEDSSLFDPACESNQWIWVELGGKRSVGVMYCCGVSPESERDEELVVEGVSLPLTENAKFTKYNDLLAGRKKVKATVIGTFFAGEKFQTSPDVPAYYGGYGHMGASSLFIVQEVISSEVVKIKMR